MTPKALRWHLEHMEDQVDDLGDLVHALLTSLVTDREWDAVDDMRPLSADETDADIVRSFAVTWTGQVMTVLGDDAQVAAPPQMFRRSIRNVLDNAGRAAGPNGVMLVSVRNSRHGTSIAVEDDGPGFGALPHQNSIGLKIVGRTVSEARGRAPGPEPVGAGCSA